MQDRSLPTTTHGDGHPFPILFTKPLKQHDSTPDVICSRKKKTAGVKNLCDVGEEESTLRGMSSSDSAVNTAMGNVHLHLVLLLLFFFFFLFLLIQTADATQPKEPKTKAYERDEPPGALLPGSARPMPRPDAHSPRPTGVCIFAVPSAGRLFSLRRGHESVEMGGMAAPGGWPFTTTRKRAFWHTLRSESPCP